jgi:demethylspheroidene O-methyltransferase
LDELSECSQLPKETIDRLVLSALSLGLLAQSGKDRYAIGALGLPVVSYPGIKAMIEHNAVLYADMLETANLLKSKEHSQMHQYWPYTLGDSAQQEGFNQQQQTALGKAKQFERYSELMSASQNFVIDEITSSYDFSPHSRMLDIGCGKGRFVSTLAQRYSDLEFDLMDLPFVMSLTQSHLAHSQFSSRVAFHPGSFKHDPLPMEMDLVTLIRIAHDHSDDVVQALLRKIYLALPAKGTLLLAEPMANPQGAKHDAYFHFYLLAMGEGRLRTPDQLSKMMLNAGFERVKLLANPMPIHTQILVAQKY